MKLHANAAPQSDSAAADGAPGCRSGLVARRRPPRPPKSASAPARSGRRYRAEGEAGLLDRSSAPGSIPHRTREDRVEAIAALRRLRMTGAEIAVLPRDGGLDGVRGLMRIGLGKLSRLEPPESPNRYERRRAGELLHVDVKKLGRIARRRAPRHRPAPAARRLPARPPARRRQGWEFVHVCVDDATRLAYVEVLRRREGDHRAPAFCAARVAFYRRHGITRRARDVGQRRLLPLEPPRARLPLARRPPPAHTPLSATHQRQSRKVHPHPPGRLGLRRHLRLIRTEPGWVPRRPDWLVPLFMEGDFQGLAGSAFRTKRRSSRPVEGVSLNQPMYSTTRARAGA